MFLVDEVLLEFIYIRPIIIVVGLLILHNLLACKCVLYVYYKFISNILRCISSDIMENSFFTVRNRLIKVLLCQTFMFGIPQ